MGTVGIDIGKVIIGGEGNHDTSLFGDHWLETPAMPGAFESISEIAQRHHVILISKCGEKIQNRSLEWLSKSRFYELTGVAPEDVLFVRKRPEKAPLAVKMGLDAFVDDRQDIIDSMKGKIPHTILFMNWNQAMGDLKKAKFFYK